MLVVLSSSLYGVTAIAVTPTVTTADSTSTGTTAVTGTYDPNFLAVFGGKPLQTQLGMRPPGSPSTANFAVIATTAATGLIRTTAANGDIVGMADLPIPVGFTVSTVTVGFMSTAVALVATSPGITTAEPLTDLVMDREISAMPEVAQLAALLATAAARQGAGYLAHPSAEVLSAMSTAVAALPNQISADTATLQSTLAAVLTAPLPSSSSTPASAVVPPPFTEAVSGASGEGSPPFQPSCDGPGIAAQGGREGDRICLSVTKDETNGSGEQVSLSAVNLAPRWAFVYSTSSSSSGSAANFLPLAVMQPKKWEISGLADLLSAIGDAVANTGGVVNTGKQVAAWLGNLVGGHVSPLSEFR